jgi:chromosome segregation ATPase
MNGILVILAVGVLLTLIHLDERISVMSAALDRLTAEVSESREATNSVLTLVAGLADQIRDLKDDPAALEALADDLDAQQSEISAAVTANTPAEEAPVEEEPAPTE